MFWKLCEAPFSQGTEEKYFVDDAPQYDSIFTYNTEKNFRNKYGAFDEEPLQIESTKELSFSDKLIEILFVIVSCFSIGVTFPFSLIFCLKFVNDYERMVIMRLGRFKTVRGPGAMIILPLVDNSFRIDTRVTRFELSSFQVITNEHGVFEISVAAFVRCVDPAAACCGIQDREQSLKSLFYTTLYKRFVRRFTDDITNPDKSLRILEKCKEELNSFTKNFGFEVTSLSINQLKMIKEGENPFISVLNTIIKSDVGSQMIGQIGTGLKAYMESNSSNFDSSIMKSPQKAENNFCEQVVHDEELSKLVERINRLCSETLVSNVQKRYKIRCILPSGDVSNIHLDLSHGSGGCQMANSDPYKPDVVISLRKDTLYLLINNEISPISAYINSLIQIEGSVSDAIKLKFLADISKELE